MEGIDHGCAPAPEVAVKAVLVVEDEVLTRFVAAELIRELGYKVIEAANADEAIGVLTAGVPVSLVFSDINMPGDIDGIGLASFLRRQFPWIPLIMTSGRLSREEASVLGFARFLTKPYSLESLTFAVGRALAT